MYGKAYSITRSRLDFETVASVVQEREQVIREFRQNEAQRQGFHHLFAARTARPISEIRQEVRNARALCSH